MDIIITMVGDRGSVTLPAGRYWFGDPCYGLSDSRHQSILPFGHAPVRQLTYADAQGLVGRTKHGDGKFSPSKGGNEIGVDSGQISILHDSMLDGDYIDGGFFITLKHDANAKFGDGVFEIQDVLLLDTNEQDDRRSEASFERAARIGQCT